MSDLKSFKLSCKGKTYAEGRDSMLCPYKDRIKSLREMGINYQGILNVIRLDYGMVVGMNTLKKFIAVNFTVEAA